jgi:cytidyltransferase-like protein
MPEVFVSGAFNDLRSRDVRFLQEASCQGNLTVILWSDNNFHRIQGRLPEFPAIERRYMLEALRYVRRVIPAELPIDPDRLPGKLGRPDIWAVTEAEDSPAKRSFCAAQGIRYQVIPGSQLDGFPLAPDPGEGTSEKRVIVSGCFDWLHSGHIRFFEQAATYGDLYVSVGNNANIRGLKGEGHPLLPQDERAYMVGSVRFVWQAFIAAGSGWLDVETSIERVQPDIYLVNEDGDRPEKRALCARYGLQYLVLKRIPRDGLPGRQSTQLRGF